MSTPLPPETDASARARVIVSVLLGALAAAATVALGLSRLAPLAGWDAASLVFLAWMWRSIWPLDAERTARRALREDPGKHTTELLLLSASVISLVAVGSILVAAGNSHGATKLALVGLGFVSVVLAWLVVHTVFCLRYARLYYGDQPGGIDFNEHDPPRYSDFAYLAFSVGMTFQVSDTNLQSKEIRATVLRQALLSYLFGAVIIAVTINLIAGLTK